ncbi:MAG: hypothetical protein ACXACX_22520 [Candidatus Hodarchaeales archaeon]|jgi:hypothetical protein
MSEGSDLKKLSSSIGKKNSLEKVKGIANNGPDSCPRCKGEKFSYWDETDEEIIFRCKSCKAFAPLAYKRDKLKFYFNS